MSIICRSLQKSACEIVTPQPSSILQERYAAIRALFTPFIGFSGSTSEITYFTQQLASQKNHQTLSQLIGAVDKKFEGKKLSKNQIGASLKRYLETSPLFQGRDAQKALKSYRSLIDKHYQITFLDRHGKQLGYTCATLAAGAALYALYQNASATPTLLEDHSTSPSITSDQVSYPDPLRMLGITALVMMVCGFSIMRIVQKNTATSQTPIQKLCLQYGLILKRTYDNIKPNITNKWELNADDNKQKAFFMLFKQFAMHLNYIKNNLADSCYTLDDSDFLKASIPFIKEHLKKEISLLDPQGKEVKRTTLEHIVVPQALVEWIQNKRPVTAKYRIISFTPESYEAYQTAQSKDRLESISSPTQSLPTTYQVNPDEIRGYASRQSVEEPTLKKYEQAINHFYPWVPQEIRPLVAFFFLKEIDNTTAKQS